MASLNYAENPTVDIMCDGEGGMFYIGSITIPKDKLYSGRILLSDLLDLIGDQLNLYEGKDKPRFLIVACRTVNGQKRMGSVKLDRFDFSERDRNFENSYILIEGHGTEPDPKLNTALAYPKADVRFRAPVGFQCRKKSIPEEYDAFMACVTSVDNYPIPSTNNLIDLKEMRITLRYMTVKKDFMSLKRHDTTRSCYQEFMSGASSGIKRSLTLPGHENSSLASIRNRNNLGPVKVTSNRRSDNRTNERNHKRHKTKIGGSVRRRTRRRKTRRR